MALINEFSRKELTAEEVYTFGILLCDNEIDRDLERFDEDSLEALSKLFLGRTGIFDHSMRSDNQISRIYYTEVKRDPIKTNSLGEPYMSLHAKAYMLRTEKNAELIAEIDGGIKKEASVSCSVAKVKCSVCGADRRTEGCEHIKGRKYGGKLCHSVLCEPTDAYEWSFVAVPAQRAAGVTKSFGMLKSILENSESEDKVAVNRKDLAAMLEHIADLEPKAMDGVNYRKSLAKETVRLGMLALPAVSSDCIEEIVSSLSTKRMEEMKAAFENAASGKIPMSVQLYAKAESSDNNEFKI
ncbi:MAG: hypothetical protein K5756_01430 [Clostridiales bacterium]|nr:hypothetical protein [Clostridiales bacterium]